MNYLHYTGFWTGGSSFVSWRLEIYISEIGDIHFRARAIAKVKSIPTECLKKNVVSWKNSHNYPQTHPKCKSRGCFGKFRIFATKWALRF